jgi:hypothetical protein
MPREILVGAGASRSPRRGWRQAHAPLALGSGAFPRLRRVRAVAPTDGAAARGRELVASAAMRGPCVG